MSKIIKATIDEAEIIHQLAHKIWYPTYGNFLSHAQISFMLEKMYSVESLISSIQSKASFFILYDQEIPVGFIGIDPKDCILRIEKIYLLPNTQGKGFGKKLIDFAADEAIKLGLPILELNVNRYNNAYNFYLKQGFKVVEEVDIPYYEFVLNDYIMRKELLP